MEEQTRRWFDAVVACGLTEVNATSVQSVRKELGLEGSEIVVEDVLPQVVELFGRQYGREMRELAPDDDFSELRRIIHEGVGGRLPELEKKNLA